MSADAARAISPSAYDSWRATPLGALTDAIEQHLIFELMGDLNGVQVLDVGCGDGALACAAGARGAVVTGVDSDAEMLGAARARAEQCGANVELVQGRMERLPFADATFDVVTTITVLCFVAEAQAAMREVARVLRPGGRLIVGELGQWSPWAAIRRVRGWFGAATWKAARFRSASELRALNEHAGLRVSTVRGAVFYPPLALCARILAPVDPRLGCATTYGAAFIALAATKMPQGAQR